MIRDDIREAIKKDLETIKPITYTTRISKVFKGYKDVSHLSESDFDAVGMIDVNTITEHYGENESMDTWELILVLYASTSEGEDDFLLSNQFEKMFEDIKDLFASQECNLALVEGVESWEVVGMTPNPYNTQTKGMAYVPMRIKYIN